MVRLPIVEVRFLLICPEFASQSAKAVSTKRALIPIAPVCSAQKLLTAVLEDEVLVVEVVEVVEVRVDDKTDEADDVFLLVVELCVDDLSEDRPVEMDLLLVDDTLDDCRLLEVGDEIEDVEDTEVGTAELIVPFVCVAVVPKLTV